MSLHCFLFISSIVIAVSQELGPIYLNPTNSTNDVINLDNAETQQSDLWLLSRDGPVPAALNRGWSPEIGYPGVQTVTSLNRGAFGYRLRGSQSPVGHMQDLSGQSENAGEVLIYTPDVQNIGERTAVVPTRPNLETTFLNFQDPESVLVELPVELSSGFWERPRPQIIQQLSSGRRVVSADGPGTIQFDSTTASHLQQGTPQEVFSPNREATSRLPVPNLQPVGDVSVRETATYDIPYQTFDAASVNLNNQSNSVSQISSENIWFPVQGRTSTGSADVLGSNDDRLLYQISFEAPTQTTAQDNVALTLTPDDIEILERLGILSSLALEDTDSSNHTQSQSVENSQREYESTPHLIDHGGQNYEIVKDGMYGTNLSDIVFIEIPEFSTSQYHGNIPDNAESTDRVRPIPYAIADSTVANPENDSYNNATSSPVFNGTSLTSEQIQEILQFLGLNNPAYSNETSETTEKLQSETETTTNAVTEKVTQGLEIPTPSDAYLSAHKNFTTSDNSTATEQLQETKETPSTITLEGRATPSAGLVSSGRIQPRILKRLPNEGSEAENEVLGLISQRISPISTQKLEFLRKLIKPKPYVFGYLQNDGNGTVQHRDETADESGSIKGHYGYRDAWGVYRNVSYIADSNGFHAVVKTNEPGTISHNPADAVIMSELPPQAAIAQMMAYVRRNNSFSTNTQ